MTFAILDGLAFSWWKNKKGCTTPEPTSVLPRPNLATCTVVICSMWKDKLQILSRSSPSKECSLCLFLNEKQNNNNNTIHILIGVCINVSLETWRLFSTSSFFSLFFILSLHGNKLNWLIVGSQVVKSSQEKRVRQDELERTTVELQTVQNYVENEVHTSTTSPFLNPYIIYYY